MSPEDEIEESDEMSVLIDGATYITYTSGNYIIRVNKADPTDKVRLARPGVKNMIVEPELKKIFYTRGRDMFSEPLDFTETTSS